MITTAELRARVEELEAVAEHVPPAVVGDRLVALLENHFEGFEAINIWDRFQSLIVEEAPPDEAAEEPEPRPIEGELEGKIVRIKLPEIGTIRARLHLATSDTMDESPAETSQSPKPAEIFDPGIPSSAEDRAAPERSEPSPMEVAVEPAEDPEDEPSKPCKVCGETKSLSGFPKNRAYKDGHTNKCKDCTREYHRQREQESRDRLAEGRQTRSNVAALPAKKAPEDRLCASGTSCAAVDPDDLIPTPAILDGANPGPLCRRCQRRAGVA